MEYPSKNNEAVQLDMGYSDMMSLWIFLSRNAEKEYPTVPLFFSCSKRTWWYREATLWNVAPESVVFWCHWDTNPENFLNHVGAETCIWSSWRQKATDVIVDQRQVPEVTENKHETFWYPL